MKTQEERRQHFQDEEVDLSYIYKKLYSGLRRISDGIRFVFNAIIHRAFLLLIFCMLGACVGYGAYKFTRPYYSSSMTLVLAEIRNDFVENQLNDLSEMIAEGNITAISEQLDINATSASQIKEMSVFNLDQDRISEDSVLTGSPFRIVLELYDNSLFGSLEPALVNYLENNRYFAKQKRIRQREVESLISKLRQEIVSIDSVKTTVASPRGPVNGFVYGEALDPTSLYRESLAMYEQQVKLEAELDQLDNIQVVNGFTPRSRPYGPALMEHIAVGLLLSFLLGLIIALILEARKVKRYSY